MAKKTALLINKERDGFTIDLGDDEKLGENLGLVKNGDVAILILDRETGITCRRMTAGQRETALYQARNVNTQPKPDPRDVAGEVIEAG
jgi:hypothetical protein